MLQNVGCCWVKFENGQIFRSTFLDVAWSCTHLALHHVVCNNVALKCRMRLTSPFTTSSQYDPTCCERLVRAAELKYADLDIEPVTLFIVC